MSNKKSRVFFASRNQRFDVTAAEPFGEIVYLFERDRPSPLRTQKVYDGILERMLSNDFDPNLDYIVLTGPNVYVAVLLAVAVAEFGGTKMLVFDAPNDRYIEQDLTESEREYESV